MSGNSDIPVDTPDDDDDWEEQMGNIGREPTQGEQNVPGEIEYTPAIVTVHWSSGGNDSFRADQVETGQEAIVLFKIEGAHVARGMGIEMGVHEEKSPIKVIPYNDVKYIDINQHEVETIEVQN